MGRQLRPELYHKEEEEQPSESRRASAGLRLPPLGSLQQKPPLRLPPLKLPPLKLLQQRSPQRLKPPRLRPPPSSRPSDAAEPGRVSTLSGVDYNARGFDYTTVRFSARGCPAPICLEF